MIVDDEPVAVRRLAMLLQNIPFVAIVARAGNAEEALVLARATTPDLVLLDIEMPGLNGVGLAAHLRALPDPPAIVFVTAFGRFALDAFNLAATDYLVKPVEPARLTEALERVGAQRAAKDAQGRVEELEGVVARLRDLEMGGADAKELWLQDRIGRERVRIDDILWVEAERDYVRVHTAARSWLLRGRIGAVAVQLERYGLARVHRSALVRLGAINRIEHRGDRAWRLHLTGGDRVDVGRSYFKTLKLCLAPGSRWDF